MRTVAMLLAQVPDVSPDPGGLPGGATIQKLVGGLAWYAVLACLAGVILGGAMWGLSGLSNNAYGVMTGKRAVVMSLLGAMVIAAASTLVGFFVNAGNGI